MIVTMHDPEWKPGYYQDFKGEITSTVKYAKFESDQTEH